MPEVQDLKKNLTECDAAASALLPNAGPVSESYATDEEMPAELRILASPAEAARPVNMPSAETLEAMEAVLNQDYRIHPLPKDAWRFVRHVPKSLIPYYYPEGEQDKDGKQIRPHNSVAYKYLVEMTYGVHRNAKNLPVAHKVVGEKMISVEDLNKNYRPFTGPKGF